MDRLPKMGVVPIEPNEAMLEAARDWSQGKYGKPIGNDAAKGCWKAMMDAWFASPEAYPGS